MLIKLFEKELRGNFRILGSEMKETMTNSSESFMKNRFMIPKKILR